MARSAFHHSLNYRSVMAFGKAHIVDEPKAKEAAMRAFVERSIPAAGMACARSTSRNSRRPRSSAWN
jgi:nitroimidazol reductase NimA-like FMN-containing flavoprotein (pyridoxamine 5'-phosphate oxidase superfamily)